MPTYSFRNVETNEVFDKWMSISERETYLKQNEGKIEPVLTAPGISYDNDNLSGKQPDEGFKDVLRNIKQRAIGGKYLQSKYIWCIILVSNKGANNIMTIDELIAELNKIKKLHGNIDVEYTYNDEGYVLDGSEFISDVDVETRRVCIHEYNPVTGAHIDGAEHWEDVKYVVIR